MEITYLQQVACVNLYISNIVQPPPNEPSTPLLIHRAFTSPSYIYTHSYSGPCYRAPSSSFPSLVLAPPQSARASYSNAYTHNIHKSLLHNYILHSYSGPCYRAPLLFPPSLPASLPRSIAYHRVGWGEEWQRCV